MIWRRRSCTPLLHIVVGKCGGEDVVRNGGVVEESHAVELLFREGSVSGRQLDQ